ncbi:MAG: HEAT repeat domain-containing protein [Armatimonadota bacterium]|nr:HEAT repeat domain-containing protein [Armatimonadota bacterium]
MKKRILPEAKLIRPELWDLIERMTVKEDRVNSADSVSWHAYRDAEKLNDLSLIPEIEAYLQQKPPRWHRSAAYFILGKVGLNTKSEQCANLLLSLLGGEPDKYALYNLLGRLEDILVASSVDPSPIFAFLHDQRWSVRHAAIRALRNTNSPHVEDEILQVIGTSSDKYDLSYCHSVLYRIGTSKSLPALQEGLKSRKRDVKSTAKAAIQAITERAALQHENR